MGHSIVMARVEWYKIHPQRRMFGTALEVYSRNEFESLGPPSYIPIACIRAKFAPAYGSINVPDTTSSSDASYESVLFVCPLRSKLFL